MRFSALFVAFMTAALVSSGVRAATTSTATPPAAEAEPKIEGLVVSRPGGGFLGIQTAGVVLRVTFYDKDKKKTPADAVRITTRWHDTKPRFAVLLPGTPDTFSSPGVFHRPYNYVVYFALVGADDKVIETHSMMLAGSDK
jgi:hypothetical protein